MDLIIDIASNSNGCSSSIPGTYVECFINNSREAGTTKYWKKCACATAVMHSGTASVLLVYFLGAYEVMFGQHLCPNPPQL